MAPNARCEVLSDAGHLIWLDQPKRCAASTVEFLKISNKAGLISSGGHELARPDPTRENTAITQAFASLG
jgi:hypothetical protein